MIKILILCTGNSCRSLLGEILFSHLGQGRIKAFSAGCQATEKINPDALAILQKHGLPFKGFKSRSWNEFTDQVMDIVITVCDNTANETYPAHIHKGINVHWEFPDPCHIKGSDDAILEAFENTYIILKQRIQKTLALPLETMPEQVLRKELNKIGNTMPQTQQKMNINSFRAK